MSSWRYILQRATTGAFLDLDYSIDVSELRWDLSGPGALRGTVSPDVAGAASPDGRPLLDPWGTLIYAEADGEIRWGGIVVAVDFEGPECRVEAAGFATYPHGIPYAGELVSSSAEPISIVRNIWTHLQSYPDANLGVTVKGEATPIRFGTPEEPYSLVWWETPDAGREIDSLANETPFDYRERHYWDGDVIRHEIEISYPRLGRKRTDLSFIQGDNVTNVVAPAVSVSGFANEVVGLGAGDGKGALRRTTAVRDGRLRRSAVYSASDVTSASRLDSLIAARLRRSVPSLEVPSITVRDHPNARIGSWQVGDDVLVEATLPWLGDVALWHRVTAWSLLSDSTAEITLTRSDSFTYGG